MDLYSNFVQGEIYVRRSDVEELQHCLLEMEKLSKLPAGQLVNTRTEEMPTYFVRNDYTRSAQEIV